MKKALLTLAVAFLGAVTGFAQDETVMQPPVNGSSNSLTASSSVINNHK